MIQIQITLVLIQIIMIKSKIMIIQVQMIMIQIFPWEEDTVIHILQNIAFTDTAGSDFLFLTLFPQKL